MHNFDTSVFDHHEMLSYTKFGNEDQHSQILHEEEVCKTVNQAVTLPVGLLQRHHARAHTADDRAEVNLLSWKPVNIGKNRVINTFWGTLSLLCTSTYMTWLLCLNSKTSYSIYGEASPFSTFQTTSTDFLWEIRRGRCSYTSSLQQQAQHPRHVNNPGTGKLNDTPPTSLISSLSSSPGSALIFYPHGPVRVCARCLLHSLESQGSQEASCRPPPPQSPLFSHPRLFPFCTALPTCTAYLSVCITGITAAVNAIKTSLP